MNLTAAFLQNFGCSQLQVVSTDFQWMRKHSLGRGIILLGLDENRHNKHSIGARVRAECSANLN